MLTSLMITFQREDSQILEVQFWSWQEAKSRFTSQRDKEIIYNCKFSKINALRKGMSGDYSDKGTYQKFKSC